MGLGNRFWKGLRTVCQPASDMKILMVCMGNICRSPLAEGVARQRFAQAGLSGLVEFDSAGTQASHAGEAPDERAQAVAIRAGIDISALRARRVMAEDFVRFDWILAMDRANLAVLERECPDEYRGKLRLFLDFAESVTGQEVPDPYYGGVEGFERVLALCEAGATGLVQFCRQQLAATERSSGI